MLVKSVTVSPLAFIVVSVRMKTVVMGAIGADNERNIQQRSSRICKVTKPRNKMNSDLEDMWSENISTRRRLNTPAYLFKKPSFYECLYCGLEFEKPKNVNCCDKCAYE